MKDNSAVLRLFVSIDLPDKVQEQVSARYTERSDLSWTPMERLHLTLAFIGETAPSSLTALDQALNQVSFPPFQLTIDQIGSFHQHLIWLGTEPSPALDALHTEIVQAIQTVLPYSPTHNFVPHITVARSKGDIGPVMLEQLQSNLLHTNLTLDVDQFALKNSVLTPNGALHQVLTLYDAKTDRLAG